MLGETIITFNIGAGTLLVGVVVFFFALLAVIWKGKGEMRQTLKEEILPFRNIANAIVEIQTIIQDKWKGITMQYTLTEQGSSPLRPTEYGVKLIKDSGLEKILDANKETLCIKLRASLSKDHTEYDVQENARNLLIELKDDPMMKPVKEYVYNYPIEIDIILRTGGLWLRDDFLEQPRQAAKPPTNKE